jgi:hypothetical protein
MGYERNWSIFTCYKQRISTRKFKASFRHGKVILTAHTTTPSPLNSTNAVKCDETYLSTLPTLDIIVLNGLCQHRGGAGNTREL